MMPSASAHAQRGAEDQIHDQPQHEAGADVDPVRQGHHPVDQINTSQEGRNM